MIDNLTIVEAAEYLRVHPNTIRKWIKSGYLKASQVGRKYFIKKSTLDEKINGGD